MYASKLLMLLIVLAVFVGASSISAQGDDDDPMTPWDVVQRCIAEPVYPPDDWTYPGMIMVSGYAGIHGVQTNWETPRVLAFFYRDNIGQILVGGQLSPDANWYAAPIGFVGGTGTNLVFHTRALRVFSMTDDTELELDFIIDDYAEDLDYFNLRGLSWVIDYVQWIDNESLILGGLLIRPFSNEVSLAPFSTTDNYFGPMEFSPDVQRVFGLLSRGEGIFDPSMPNETFVRIERVHGVAWQHDSSRFIVDHGISVFDYGEADSLALYNRDGEFIETVFNQDTGSINIERYVARRSELGWSADDNYFAFVYQPSPSESSKLLIIDMQNRIIVDTCLNPVSQPIWSLDGTMLAYLGDTSANLNVIVVDLDNWQSYIVARHIETIGTFGISTGGYGVPDMVGWRDAVAQ